MANTRVDAVALARSQIGVHESPAGSNRTPYGKWFGFDGVAWCGEFVSWVLAHVGNQSDYRFASTATSVAWARRVGRLIPLDQAKPGDVVVHLYTKTTGHTGIFVAFDKGAVHSVEGNTSSADDRNGGIVQERVRTRAFWQYCIRIDFDEPAPAAPPVPEEDDMPKNIQVEVPGGGAIVLLNLDSLQLRPSQPGGEGNGFLAKVGGLDPKVWKPTKEEFIDLVGWSREAGGWSDWKP